LIEAFPEWGRPEKKISEFTKLIGSENAGFVDFDFFGEEEVEDSKKILTSYKIWALTE